MKKMVMALIFVTSPALAQTVLPPPLDPPRREVGASDVIGQDSFTQAPAAPKPKRPKITEAAVEQRDEPPVRSPAVGDSSNSSNGSSPVRADPVAGMNEKAPASPVPAKNEPVEKARFEPGVVLSAYENWRGSADTGFDIQGREPVLGLRTAFVNPVSVGTNFKLTKLPYGGGRSMSPIFKVSGYFNATVPGRYVFSIGWERMSAPNYRNDLLCGGRVEIDGDRVVFGGGWLSPMGTLVPSSGGVDLQAGRYELAVIYSCEYRHEFTGEDNSASVRLRVRRPGEDEFVEVSPKDISRPVKQREAAAKTSSTKE